MSTETARRDAVWDQIAALTRDWPEVTRVESFGNPALKAAAKLFAVLDRYKGVDVLWVKVDPGLRADLVTTGRWGPAPYDARETALMAPLNGLDDSEIPNRLAHSYRQVALKRMLKEFTE